MNSEPIGQAGGIGSMLLIACIIVVAERIRGWRRAAEGRIRCVCCGHEWKATEHDIEKARAADRAWEVAQRLEQEARGSD